MDFDEDLNIAHRHVHRVSNTVVVTRVGGNPESMLRFQTHFMSDLVDDEFNNADGF